MSSSRLRLIFLFEPWHPESHETIPTLTESRIDAGQGVSSHPQQKSRKLSDLAGYQLPAVVGIEQTLRVEPVRPDVWSLISVTEHQQIALTMAVVFVHSDY